MKKQVDEIILPCVDMGYVELNTTKIIRFYQEMFGPKKLEHHVECSNNTRASQL